MVSRHDADVTAKRTARLTAQRRASSERIRAGIREHGRTPLPKDPPLLDASDLSLTGTKPLPKNTYDPKYAAFAAEMCRLGATDVEVARGLNVSLSTLWYWQAKHEEFFKAFLEGKDHCDDRVERSLYLRAVGYTYPTVKIMSHQGQPVVVPYLEHLPPDVSAQSRWLKSRRKENWGDQAALEIKGDDVFTEVWQAIATGQVLPLLKGAGLSGGPAGGSVASPPHEQPEAQDD